MEVRVYNVLFELIVLFMGFDHTAANTQTIEMCRHSVCIDDCTCHSKIQCDSGTEIRITSVEYRDNIIFCPNTNCGFCCYTELQISAEHKRSIMERCNDKQSCNLDSWNSNKSWKMKITYICHRQLTSPGSTSPTKQTTTPITTVPTKLTTQPSSATTVIIYSSSPRIETNDSFSSITVKSPSHSPEHSTDSGRIVKTKEEESAGFPLGAIIAIPVGIVVMILLIVGLVCVVRRRSHRTQKGRKKSTLPMQDMTANDNDNSQPSGNREHQQENHEQDYVDTTTNEGKTIYKQTVEQEYVDTDRGGINTTDDDEYNTLNTHQAPVQIDPNYDHLPKDSHTTVDETYSHVTDSQTTVHDATYSHLQDCKSNAAQNVKCNTDNVYNHINTLSVEDNVYKNTETNFTQNLTSNLSQIRAEEDDYDHTDWNQAKSTNPIASRNGAINKSVGDNITEDEYAVVNKQSDDKVESNDGHNYFVLEKKSF